MKAVVTVFAPRPARSQHHVLRLLVQDIRTPFVEWMDEGTGAGLLLKWVTSLKAFYTGHPRDL